ncbi:MAG: hypothetical protein GXO90_09390 [FCB group bacterium]|nr:hypothetical protein [FCB group bacterium]
MFHFPIRNRRLLTGLGFLFLVIPQWMTGQPVQIPMITNGEAPRWSPDGMTIAFTGPQFTGIYLYSINDQRVDTLSNEPAAGFGMSWSPAGGKIAARIGMRMDGRQFFSLVVYSLQTGQTEYLTDFRKGLSGTPIWDRQGSRVALNNSAQFQSWEVGTATSSGPMTLVIKDRLITISSDGSRIPIPIPEDGPIIESDFAPDGNMVAFKVLGGHLWLQPVDGSKPVNLGFGNSPRFSPDGKMICYTKIEDDGHRLLNADIYINDFTGQQEKNLTRSPGVIELHPDWSPDGKQIVYDTNDGRIWTLEVTK